MFSASKRFTCHRGAHQVFYWSVISKILDAHHDFTGHTSATDYAQNHAVSCERLRSSAKHRKVKGLKVSSKDHLWSFKLTNWFRHGTKQEYQLIHFIKIWSQTAHIALEIGMNGSVRQPLLLYSFENDSLYALCINGCY